MMEDFLKYCQFDANLTGKDRMRLYGAGKHNIAFISKAFETARANPDYSPRYVDLSLFEGKLRDLEELRELKHILLQFAKTASNACLFKTNLCYRDALSVYRCLRELAKSKIPGAQKLFSPLRQFYNRPKRKPAE